MENKLPKKLIYPDENSWLSEMLISFLKNFKNEIGLTLWDALGEYVSFHNPYCVYQGKIWEGEVFLYPQVSYDHGEKKAVLERLFLVSPEAKTVLSNDYLKGIMDDRNSTPFVNLMKKCINPNVDEYPGLEFMVVNNSMEPSLAKEMMLRTSYRRRMMKKNYILENEALGIEYKNVDIVRVTFDLRLLERCRFFEAKRYESFRELLTEGLVFSLTDKVGYDLPDVPEKLKKQQLIDVTSVSN